MSSTKGTLIKRIEVGCRVEGRFGDFIPNTDPKKKRRRDVAYATVVEASGPKKWMVRFDVDGLLHEASSRSMKVVDGDCGVPLEDAARSRTNNDATNDEMTNVSFYKYGLVLYCLTLFFVLAFSHRS